MHYQIYIPGVSTPNDDHLLEVGLDSLYQAGAEWADVLRNGPDGGSGMICSWSVPVTQGTKIVNPPMKVVPGHQWRPAEPIEDADLAEGRYWIGINPISPPLPEELQRPKMFPGRWVTLSDGNQWHIPVAMQLPHRIRYSRGQYRRTVQDDYKQFYDRSERLLTQIFDELDIWDLVNSRDRQPSPDPHPIMVSEGAAMCQEALNLNYRLPPEVLDALELMDDESMRLIVASIIDLPDIIATREIKKKEDSVAIPLG